MKKTAYLFSRLGSIKKALKGRLIYLLLDYDGTLAPIVRVPGEAAIPRSTKDLLRRLSRTPDCRIAVVSGRALKDLSARVGIKGIVYVGNHGFEIRGPKIRFKSPVSLRYRKTLDEIKAKLKKRLGPIKGTLIEDKGFSLSVHYRLADKKGKAAVKNEFYDTLFPYLFKKDVRTTSGKMILEVRPPVSWNKGKVVLWLLGQRSDIIQDKRGKVLPLYIGDDTTDEDAFESLKDRGITIFVGRPGKTKARFYLKDTSEVARFLRDILENITQGARWRKKR